MLATMATMATMATSAAPPDGAWRGINADGGAVDAGINNGVLGDGGRWWACRCAHEAGAARIPPARRGTGWHDWPPAQRPSTTANRLAAALHPTKAPTRMPKAVDPRIADGTFEACRPRDFTPARWWCRRRVG